MNLNTFWDNIPKGHRGTYPIDDVKFQLSRAIKCFNLDNIKIKTILDWGIGTGDLISLLQKKYLWEVVAVDVSKKSLHSSKRQVNLTKAYLLPNKIDNFSTKEIKVDAIFCHAVVWHMPNFDYFKKVVRKWSQMKPQYIFFNAKIDDKTMQTKPYNNKNYLNSLILDFKSVVNLFNKNGYDLYYHTNGTRNNKFKTQIYFTFINDSLKRR